MSIIGDNIRDEDLAAVLWALDWLEIDPNNGWEFAHVHEREGYLRKAAELRFFLEAKGLKVVAL